MFFHVFSVSILELIFDCIFDETWLNMTSKIDPRGYLFGQNGSKKLRPRTTGSVLEPTFFEHQNFDDILEPFSPILLSFGSKLAHFGRLLASFLKLLAPFCMHFLHVATFWLQPEEPKQSKLAPSALTHSLTRSLASPQPNKHGGGNAALPRRR